MQTYCTDTHLVTCTCTARTYANILYQNAYEYMYTKLPQSCTKVVPIHYLCIVCPSPVHVQRLYSNINNSNSVLNMYLHLYLYSTRTSTVPVHTKYIPVASTYKYLCGVKTPPTLEARFITLPCRAHDKTPPTSYDKIFEFRKQSVKRHQHLVW